jgi:hypothetical protein
VVGDGADHQLQDREVGGTMSGPERALLLRPGHEHVDRGGHALAHLLLALGPRPVPSITSRRPAVEGLDLAYLLQRPGQPQPGVRFRRGLAHVLSTVSTMSSNSASISSSLSEKCR